MKFKIAAPIIKEVKPKIKAKVSGGKYSIRSIDSKVNEDYIDYGDINVFMIAKARFNCYNGVFKGDVYYYYRWIRKGKDGDSIYRVYAYYEGDETNYIEFKKKFFDKYFLEDEDGAYKVLSSEVFNTHFIKKIKKDSTY